MSANGLAFHILVAIFGISAWLGINSLLTELPIIIQTAPEGWSLPSQIIIILQLGNLGSILLMYLKTALKINNFGMITFLLVLSVVAALVVGGFSHVTLFLFGSPRSIPIFFTAFVFALIGYSSLVLFIPFMGIFKEAYLISYFIGESFSSLVPGSLALVQGIDENKNCETNSTIVTDIVLPTLEKTVSKFGVRCFFVVISFVFVSSLLAFLIISAKCNNEHLPLIVEKGKLIVDNNNKENSPDEISKADTSTLLFILFFSFMLYSGVLPSIQSFSCLPHGSNVYHMAVTLSNISNPATCFLGHYVTHNCRRVKLLTVIIVVLDVCLIATSLVQIQTNFVGICILILMWVVTPSLHSFVRVSICAIFRQQKGNLLENSGKVIQIAAFVGAATGFAMVNYTSWLSTQIVEDACGTLEVQ